MELTATVYLSTIDQSRAANKGPRRALFLLSGNVFALGAVSLITDVSSEMVTAVLPVYLVLGLHLSPAAYGTTTQALPGTMPMAPPSDCLLRSRWVSSTSSTMLATSADCLGGE